MGYHKKKIDKGVLGEFSKIKEEFDELSDAHEQSNPILEVCELCDLLGAIESYAKKWNLTIEDLLKMKDSTKSAFEEGSRK